MTPPQTPQTWTVIWSCGGCGHDYHGREGQGLACSAKCRCPGGDEVCQHGTASDVHCCGCHPGFIFDLRHNCDRELRVRRLERDREPESDPKLNAEAANEAPLPDAGDNSLGLSVCMLDVDRLRDWARNIATHGSDISQWGSVEFVQRRMERMADGLDGAVRDIGKLRAQVREAEALETEVRAVLASLPQRFVVRVREGNGPENVAASLAVSVANLVNRLEREPPPAREDWPAKRDRLIQETRDSEVITADDLAKRVTP